jgi:hypothetical protein
MFEYPYEVLQQTEVWCDKKKRVGKLAMMSHNHRKNAYNYVIRNASTYRDSLLKWSLDTMYLPAEQYAFIRDMPATEWAKRQPLMIELWRLIKIEEDKND